MALENAQWIDELVTTNPVFNDPVGQGDDHTRLLKVVLDNTFVGAGGDIWDSVGGALLKGPAYLNALPAALDGVTAGDVTIVGIVSALNFAMPNLGKLTGRNFADDADADLIHIDASDNVTVGEVGFDTVILGDSVTIDNFILPAFTAPIEGVDGTAVLPSYTFFSETGTGMFVDGATLGFSQGGVATFSIDAVAFNSTLPVELRGYATGSLPDPSLLNDGAITYDTTLKQVKVVTDSAWTIIPPNAGDDVLALDPVVYTAPFTAVSGMIHQIDTSGGPFIITLPTGSIGVSRVGYIDYGRSFATNFATWTTTEKIEGSDEDYDMDLQGASGVLRYLDATKGWLDAGGFA